MTHSVLVRPECIAFGGDVVVGMLLSQIVYWHTPDKQGRSKLRVHREGVYWIAKTREEWMEETGLTLERYKRALKVLKAKALIETRIMRFRGLAMTHVRLVRPITDFIETKAVETLAPVGGFPATHTEITSEKTDQCSGEMSIKIDHGGDSLTGKSLGMIEDQKQDQKQDQEPDQDQDLAAGFVKGHPGWAMKAKDVLAAQKTIVNGSLAAYWKSRCHLVADEYQHALTGKQMGQLKQLHKYLGDKTKPIIDYAVNNWWTFGTTAREVGGLLNFPSDPDIGFLLKYYHVAENLLASTAISPPKAVGEPQPVQLIASNAVQEPAHVLTPKELTEYLDWLDKP